MHRTRLAGWRFPGEFQRARQPSPNRPPLGNRSASRFVVAPPCRTVRPTPTRSWKRRRVVIEPSTSARFESSGPNRPRLNARHACKSARDGDLASWELSRRAFSTGIRQLRSASRVAIRHGGGRAANGASAAPAGRRVPFRIARARPRATRRAGRAATLALNPRWPRSSQIDLWLRTRRLRRTPERDIPRRHGVRPHGQLARLDQLQLRARAPAQEQNVNRQRRRVRSRRGSA